MYIFLALTLWLVIGLSQTSWSSRLEHKKVRNVQRERNSTPPAHTLGVFVEPCRNSERRCLQHVHLPSTNKHFVRTSKVTLRLPLSSFWCHLSRALLKARSLDNSTWSHFRLIYSKTTSDGNSVLPALSRLLVDGAWSWIINFKNYTIFSLSLLHCLSVIYSLKFAAEADNFAS